MKPRPGSLLDILAGFLVAGFLLVWMALWIGVASFALAVCVFFVAALGGL
jgi:hypothetical protein